MATRTQIEYTSKVKTRCTHTVRGMHSRKILAWKLLDEGVVEAKIRYQMNDEWGEWDDVIKDGKLLK